MKLEKGSQIRIRYQSNNQKPQQIWVAVLATIGGNNLVAVDKQGQLYTTYWQTETARPRGNRVISKRHWRRYPKGLYSLERGLLYALIEAEEVKIPTLRELQEFCQDKCVQIRILENDISELQTIAAEFTELKAYLAAKTRWTFRESNQQLRFFLLLRDGLGRINIGVLQARLSAIDWRFSQELKNLVGWMPHYAARISTVITLQKQFERSTETIGRKLGAMLAHQAFKTGKTQDRQIALMCDVLNRQILILQTLRQIQPFTKWATYCLEDLIKADDLLYRKQFTDAQVVIKRVLQAMHLRIFGFQLEELIKQLGFDLLLGRTDKTKLGKAVQGLCRQFRRINEIGFAEPVKAAILASLEAAEAAIKDGQYPQAKALLKQAADKI